LLQPPPVTFYLIKPSDSFHVFRQLNYLMGFYTTNVCNISFRPSAIKVLLILGICIHALFSQHLVANEPKEGKIFRSRVVQLSDSTSIPNAHVINLGNGRGTSTAADGSFNMAVEAGDKVLFTALGFHNHTLIVDSAIFENELPTMVVLEEKMYDLPVVEIYPYATFTDFKYAFLNFKDPEPAIKLNLPKSFNIATPGEGFGVTIKGPITALYDQFSKRGKELRNYQEVIEKEELRRKASRVVNVETVRRYTHLRDEAEIYRFLRFCNMPDEYIIASTEYEVYQQLMACYQQYCEMEK
jgi:hypothetical protein